jgi:cyanate lyase
MSAINFKLQPGKTEHAGADHIVLTFDGKFLRYNWPTD